MTNIDWDDHPSFYDETSGERFDSDGLGAFRGMMSAFAIAFSVGVIALVVWTIWF